MSHFDINGEQQKQISIRQEQTFYDLFRGGKPKISIGIIQLGNFDPFSGLSLAHKAHFKSDRKKILQNIKIKSKSKPIKNGRKQLNFYDGQTRKPHSLFFFFCSIDFNRSSFGSWFYLPKF